MIHSMHSAGGHSGALGEARPHHSGDRQAAET